MQRASYFETSRSDLKPDPIEPSWIKDGSPIARSVTLSRSLDGSLTAGLWDCTAGRFTWIFKFDEVAHILEGEVHVSDGATTHVLLPGSVMHFPRGLKTDWKVPRYVKKSFTLRAPQRSRLRRVASGLKQQILAMKRRRQAVAVLAGCIQAGWLCGALA
jgi:uncharacterized cupin superfamily protein